MANPVMVRTAYLSSPKPRHLTRSNQFIAAAVGVCPFKASKHLYYSPLIVFNTHHCLSAVTPRTYSSSRVYTSHNSHKAFTTKARPASLTCQSAKEAHLNSYHGRP